MFKHVNPKNDIPSPLIAEDVYAIIAEVCLSAAATIAAVGAASRMTMFPYPSGQAGNFC